MDQIPGTPIYTGGGDFTACTAALDGGTDYELIVNNLGTGQPLWPSAFVMAKDDGDPSQIIGRYSGGGGKAVVGDN
ncbi:MAG: hypothetical protein AAF916_10240 [Planctomycetota bacterium]